MSRMPKSSKTVQPYNKLWLEDEELNELYQKSLKSNNESLFNEDFNMTTKYNPLKKPLTGAIKQIKPSEPESKVDRNTRYINYAFIGMILIGFIALVYFLIS